jgi:hypothetical protein
MKKFEVNLLKCKLNNITPNDYVLLYLMHYKKYPDIEKIFGRDLAVSTRNVLTNTKYILSDTTTTFKETVLSGNVKKLLDIKDDIINFWEWYLIYPQKFDGRIFRAANPESKIAKDHKRKYLSKVKSIEEHVEICERTRNFVELKRQKGELQYLYQIDRVLNNNMWEQWDGLKVKSKTWNQTTI